MAKTIKYIGTQDPWPEISVTGKQSIWHRGQIEERTDSEAGQLLGSGLFSEVQSRIATAAQISTDSFGKAGGFTASGISAGDVIQGMEGPDKPTLVWGFDHPTKQLIPNDGTHDSLHQYFKDNGLFPYFLTVCTRQAASSPSESTDPELMSWADVRQIQSEGVEITNHSARHLSHLGRICTGYQLRYLGSDTTASAYVTDSPRRLNLVSSTAGTTTFDLTNASYDTLAGLKTAVEAISGWQMTLAVELDGTERSADTLVVATPGKSCKPVGGLFSTGGGLTVRYKGSSYRNAFVNTLNAGPGYIQFWGDGVLVAEYDLTNASYNTLAKVATAASALDSGDWEVLVMDDILVNNNLPYCDGTEACQGNLQVVNAHDCYQQFQWLTAGMPVNMIWRKLLKSARDDAAAKGVRMQNFSDVGGGAFTAITRQISEFSNMSRSTTDKATIAPAALPAYAASSLSVYTYDANTTTKTNAQVAAVPLALADSPGHVVSMFMHQVDNFDGSTGKNFYPRNPVYANGYWNEAGLKGFADNVKAIVAAKGLNRLTQQGFFQARGRFAPPPNFVFNPKWKNSGNAGAEALAGLAVADSGARVPGWQVSFPNVTSIVIDADGNLTAALNVASANNYMKAMVWLEPGKTYNVGLLVETLAYTSGQGISMALQPLAGYEYLSEIGNTGQGLSFDEYAGSAVGVHKAWNENFTVPLPPRKRAYVRARTGTAKDLSTNKNIRINFDSIGTVDVDCSSGAVSASAVLAWEMAAAINAAVKANTSYAARSEYHNCARAENGRLIIESPYASFNTTTSARIVLSNGATVSATTLIFGTSGGTSQPVGRFSTSGQQGLMPYMLGIVINAVGTFRLSSPRIQMIEGIL